MTYDLNKNDYLKIASSHQQNCDFVLFRVIVGFYHCILSLRALWLVIGSVSGLKVQELCAGQKLSYSSVALWAATM